MFRSLVLMLALVAPLLGPTKAAHAQSTTSTLTAGVGLFHRGEFEAAIGVLESAVTTHDRSGERARGHLFIGLAHAVLGAWSEARASFRRALEDDVEIQPDVDRIPPAIVAAFEEVRTSLTGRLEVDAPQPSNVYVDVVDVGPTPFAGELPVGRHHVLVRSTDGRNQMVRSGVLVEVARTTRLDVVLKPRSGRLSILSRPTGAEVWVADRHIGTTPVTDIRLPAGMVTVQIQKKGFETVTRTVQVVPANNNEVDIVLRRPQVREAFASPAVFGPDLRDGVDRWSVNAACGFGGLQPVASSVQVSPNKPWPISGGLGFNCEMGVGFFDLVEVTGSLGLETFGPEDSFFRGIAPSVGPTVFNLGEDASGVFRLSLLRFGLHARVVVARIGRVRAFGGFGIYTLPRVARITHIAIESAPGADDAFQLHAFLSGTAVTPSAGAKITVFEGAFMGNYVAADIIVEGRLELMKWTFSQDARFSVTGNAAPRAQAAQDVWAAAIDPDPSSVSAGVVVWVGGRI